MAKDTIGKRQAYGLGAPLQGMHPLPIVADRAPRTSDRGYPIGQVWINQPLDDAFILTSVVNNLARWDSITAATPGSAPISRFIVAADGTAGYTTIQAAINAAVTAGGNATVYVRPGTYTENLTLATTVDIVGAINTGTTITGVHVPPAAGRVQFQNLTLTSATHIFSSAAAGTATITLLSCDINATNGYTFSLVNWTGTLVIDDCGDASTNNGIVNNTAGATLFFTDSSLGAGAGNAFVASGGTVVLENVDVICAGTFGGAAVVRIDMGSRFERTITTANTAAVTIISSSFSTGATAAITHGSANPLTLSNVSITSSNNPAIAGAGAGAVILTGCEFTDGSNLAATLTLTHTAETRSTKLLCGDSVYRVNAFTTEGDIVQSYGSDTTAAGASTRNAIEGNLTVTSGNGAHSPNAIQGAITAVSGSNLLMSFGVRGYNEQQNGSVIASTAAGVEGHLNLLETNAADLPTTYAFAVKGYLDSTDGAGVPVAITAGVGSIVEYNTPFNAKAYGFATSRLNTGGGAGTAGQAAYGVVQGLNAIPDWLYGLDLRGGGAIGTAYTNADIRFHNSVTSKSNYVDIEQPTTGATAYPGVRYSGNLDARSLNATNINIRAFNQSPIVQSNLNTGVAPSGVAGDINLIHLQDGSVMEEFVITAQAILAPRMTATGLEIGGDQIATNGYEYNWGVDANRRFAYVAQTALAFFIEATFVVTTVANVEHFFVGFRRNAANNPNYALYTDGAMIGLHPVTNAATAIIAQSLNGPGWAYTNTTNAWANGTTHKVRVNVAANGVVTYLIDGAAPVAIPAAQTFDAGDVIIPFIHFSQAAAAFTPIKITQMAVGFQAYT